MIKVTLTRNKTNGKAVYGTLTFAIGFVSCSYPTIENADYLIKPGTYTLERTWSPKFKKRLPLISGVPGRDGLRIHRGTKPEHSKGCVLVGSTCLASLESMFNIIKREKDEKVIITIGPA